MKRHIAVLLLGVAMLAGCADSLNIKYGSITAAERKHMPTYGEFIRNRQECKQLAESLCPYPLNGYCTLDVYQKRIVFIKNCMHERGWNDPYNMFSYYK